MGAPRFTKKVKNSFASKFHFCKNLNAVLGVYFKPFKK